MIPGTVLFDPHFKFDDGDEGRKLFIVLSNGECGHYVTAKTTSRNTKGRYSKKHGCQSGRYPCFSLPEGTCGLRGNTWIQLHVFFEFNAGEVIARKLRGEIREICRLPRQATLDLLRCAIRLDDISLAHEEEVRRGEITVMDIKETDWVTDLST